MASAMALKTVVKTFNKYTHGFLQSAMQTRIAKANSSVLTDRSSGRKAENFYEKYNSKSFQKIAFDLFRRNKN